MYHKLLLPALMLTSSLTVSAQSTLTATGNNPRIGESYLVKISSGTPVDAGTGGAAKEWNFSFLGFFGTTTTDTNSVLSCASGVSPACSSFPGSNIVLSGSSVTSNAKNYLNASLTSLSQIGAHVSADTSLVMSDPADQLRYPFTYLSSFTDNFSGILTVGGISARHNGTVSVTCDGYGTLVLPGRTESGVLRVHSVQTFTDSINILGTPVTRTYSISSHDWYRPDYHSPLLTIQVMTEVGVPSPAVYKFVAYAAAGLSAVKELQGIATTLQVYPNPVTDLLRVRCEAAGQPSITLFDALGRVAATGVALKTGSSYSCEVPVAELPRGMYLLQITDGAERVSRKVSLQ
jgi:hypothetical protein